MNVCWLILCNHHQVHLCLSRLTLSVGPDINGWATKILWRSVAGLCAQEEANIAFTVKAAAAGSVTGSKRVLVPVLRAGKAMSTISMLWIHASGESPVLLSVASLSV